MRLSLLTLLTLATAPALAQQPSPAPTASSVVAPALDQISSALSGIQLDKWKSPDAVREETNANMASISRDLDGTLPPLLAAADAAPGKVSTVLPVFQNVDALYDVLLRVTAAAEHGAPRPQQEALGDALSALENARHGLGDVLGQAAGTQEATIRELRSQLTALKAAPTPVPDCPAPRPVHHTVKKHHTETHPESAQTPQQ